MSPSFVRRGLRTTNGSRLILFTCQLLAAALVALSGVVLTAAPPASALGNRLATKPPLGWNSWNFFRCYGLNERVVREAADAMVSSGLGAAGYEYVVIDDCWQANQRDAGGRLQAHPERFPSGIKALADHIHGKGLKIGIYGSPGRRTCAMDWDNYPGTDLGSLGHEDLDARTWAEWGADYVKYDWCGAERDGLTPPAAFARMRDAIARTGRPMVYSISEYGDASPWTWARPIANSWRTTSDIRAEWSSVMSIVDGQAGLEPFSGPGAWNDPDMLQVGNGSLSTNENRAHYSLWALLGAPLMLGNDLREMNQSIRDVLTNRDVIAVNQDWGGSQGRKIRDFGLTEVWAKPMSDGSVTVALLNRGSAGATISTSAAELGLAGSSSYGTKDLWTGTTGTTAGAISSTVDGHGVTVLRVNRIGTAQAGLAAGTHNVGDLPWVASSNGWGPAERNRSNGESGSADGTTMRIAGTPYTTGIGVHADSAVHVHLGRACTRFTASVGIDDETAGKGSARFAVYGDGRLLAYTDVKTSGPAATPISVSVAGVRALELRTTDGRDGIDHDHADWADAKVTCGADAGTVVAVGDLPYAASVNGWGPVETRRLQRRAGGGRRQLADAERGALPEGPGSPRDLGREPRHPRRLHPVHRQRWRR